MRSNPIQTVYLRAISGKGASGIQRPMVSASARMSKAEHELKDLDKVGTRYSVKAIETYGPVDCAITTSTKT
jgi:hypothetical protein